MVDISESMNAYKSSFDIFLSKEVKQKFHLCLSRFFGVNRWVYIGRVTARKTAMKTTILGEIISTPIGAKFLYFLMLLEYVITPKAMSIN